jgi:hypothetical protein
MDVEGITAARHPDLYVVYGVLASWGSDEYIARYSRLHLKLPSTASYLSLSSAALFLWQFSVLAGSYISIDRGKDAPAISLLSTFVALH